MVKEKAKKPGVGAKAKELRYKMAFKEAQKLNRKYSVPQVAERVAAKYGFGLSTFYTIWKNNDYGL